MEQRLAYLIEQGTRWIVDQRDHHRPSAVELSASNKESLSPFFSSETLAAVRVREVHQIGNPGFYDDLRRMDQEIPFDFSQMAGITFVDTVLLSQTKIRQAPILPLIFHECVHVVQYQILGVDEFIRRYVMGWAMNNRDYYSIPLEKDAYGLQSQFENSPDTQFSIESEVALRLEN